MARTLQKSSGAYELFNLKKLRRSLIKAGVSPAHAGTLTQEVKDNALLDSTPKIFRYVLKRLKKIDRPTAARYSLKHALYELGPMGFRFERFMAMLLSKQGYRTSLDQTLDGNCIDHEIDIIAKHAEGIMIVECKFRNRPGTKTDVTDALYTKARFDDLSARANSRINSVMLATNTQFTSKAIQYGSCAGVLLLGWNFPLGSGIADLIHTLGMHPITSLTCLTKVQKKELLDRNILLCKELLDKPHLIDRLHLRPTTQKKVRDECTALCRGDS